MLRVVWHSKKSSESQGACQTANLNQSKCLIFSMTKRRNLLPDHYGPELPKIQIYVWGKSFIDKLVPSHRSLIPLLCPDRLGICLFVFHRLTHELVGKWIIRWRVIRLLWAIVRSEMRNISPDHLRAEARLPFFCFQAPIEVVISLEESYFSLTTNLSSAESEIQRRKRGINYEWNQARNCGKFWFNSR